MGLLGEVVAAARTQLVVVLAEAKRRSLGVGQGWGAVDWARSVAPLLPTRDLLDAHEVATAMASAGISADGGDHRLDDLVDAVAERPHRPGRTGLVRWGWARRRWCAGSTGPCAAWPTPGVLGEATATLVDAARGPAGLDERQLAAAVRHAGQLLRPDRVVEHDAAVRRAHRSLVKGRGPVGMWGYTLVLDDEGAAVVDAAVDALAKPARDAHTNSGTGTGTGERDPREARHGHVRHNQSGEQQRERRDHPAQNHPQRAHLRSLGTPSQVGLWGGAHLGQTLRHRRR